ncbi:MAG: AAA family ATPase [Saccharolobus sp.]
MPASLVRILSLKGGIGKSSIAYSLAKIITISRYKVLLIDMDNLFTISRILDAKPCELKISQFAIYACKDGIKIPTSNYDHIIIDTYAGITKDKVPQILANNIFNVFVTDYFTVPQTLDYMREWDEGRNVLAINMINFDNREDAKIAKKAVQNQIAKRNAKVDKIILMPFDEHYYGSYKVNMPKIELLVGFILNNS